MGRGSSQNTDATAALRALPGGRVGAPKYRQPPMDPALDRLWLSHAKELTRAAEALAKVERLAGPQRGALLGRLNRLGAAVGLAPVWQLVERDRPDGSTFTRAGYIVGGHVHSPRHVEKHFLVLEDEFEGGTIGGMSEPRYLGRKLCELPGDIARYLAAGGGALAR